MIEAVGLALAAVGAFIVWSVVTGQDPIERIRSVVTR